MRILLVDTTLYAPVSPFFVEAARDLGYEHLFIDDAPYLRPLETSLIHKVGYRVLHWRPLTSWSLNRALLAEARRFRPDLMVVVKGTYIMPATLRRIKEDTGAILINYATDDPFNRANATPDLTHGIPAYDVYACTKRVIMDDVRRAGCRTVVHKMVGYKPSVHFPEPPATDDEARRFRSDVVLIGGADRDRLQDLQPLLAACDISPALYGGTGPGTASSGRTRGGSLSDGTTAWRWEALRSPSAWCAGSTETGTPCAALRSRHVEHLCWRNEQTSISPCSAKARKRPSSVHRMSCWTRYGTTWLTTRRGSGSPGRATRA